MRAVQTLMSCAAVFCLATAGIVSKSDTGPTSEFITLGTMAGPIPDPQRSQPSNLLRIGDLNILIDVGDGTAEQLAKVQVPLNDVRHIFISHLHFDHTGVLFGFLGMRYQPRGTGVVTVYGPQGTRRTVEGLVAAMQPMSEAGVGVPGQTRNPPENMIRVQEVSDGDVVVIGDVRITAAVNSHYSFPADSDDAARYQSLSFRFDLPDRSIVYTGDTGPSKNVERLANGADLLVSEVIDPDRAMALLGQAFPNAPEPLKEVFRYHMLEQHLVPEEVGKLAEAASVGRLVLTHHNLVGDGLPSAVNAIAKIYRGPVTVANDLDRF